MVTASDYYIFVNDNYQQKAKWLFLGIIPPVNPGVMDLCTGYKTCFIVYASLPAWTTTRTVWWRSGCGCCPVVAVVRAARWLVVDSTACSAAPWWWCSGSWHAVPWPPFNAWYLGTVILSSPGICAKIEVTYGHWCYCVYLQRIRSLSYSNRCLSEGSTLRSPCYSKCLSNYSLKWWRTRS